MDLGPFKFSEPEIAGGSVFCIVYVETWPYGDHLISQPSHFTTLAQIRKDSPRPITSYKAKHILGEADRRTDINTLPLIQRHYTYPVQLSVPGKIRCG